MADAPHCIATAGGARPQRPSWLSALHGQIVLLAAGSLFGCSDRLELGSDLVWSADTESADLSQWEALTSDAVLLPNAESSIEVTSEQRHGGGHAVKLVNPANWDNEELGPELLHDVGPVDDAYYSAWFLLPVDHQIEASLTFLELKSRDAVTGELFNGEQLQLRSLPSGGYVLQVFHNNASFLLEPVAAKAPLVTAGSWFHVEARFQPTSGGKLRVWLNGSLSYDLEGRPEPGGSDVVFDACNVAESARPTPLTLFVDDAAVSASRVGPSGHLSFD
jgi:hypothetical protein